VRERFLVNERSLTLTIVKIAFTIAPLGLGEGKEHATSTFEADGAFSYEVGKSQSMAPRAESQFHLEDKA